MNDKKSIEEKLANSLTADTVELISFLPYLLQDLWEIGSSPEDIIELIKENVHEPSSMNIIDLACGKGAVSVKLAKEFGVKITGIDIVDEFIKYAKQKASESGVAELCSFRSEDINVSVKKESGYDCAILGAAGDILGSPEETVEKLKKVLMPSGYIILDEAFLKNKNASNEDIRYRSYDYLHYEQWVKIFENARLKICGEIIADEDKLENTNNSDLDFISKRARELSEKYPGKRSMFEAYVKNQQKEVDDIQKRVSGVTWLLQRMN